MIWNILLWIAGIFVVICVIGGVISVIAEKKYKEKFQLLMDSDPEGALKEIILHLDRSLNANIENGTETDYINRYVKGFDEYEQDLITIAEKHQFVKAMTLLYELYDGSSIYSKKSNRIKKAIEKKKDLGKSRKWKKQAAATGDFDAILDCYEFFNFKVTGNAYAEMLHDLNNVKPKSSEEKAFIQYLMGVVYYESGKFDDAKKLFIPAADKDDNSKFMLARCFEKEGNFSEVDKLLHGLESADWDDFDYDILGEVYSSCGFAYLKGNCDVKKDINKAVVYLGKAANFGHVSSMAIMGTLMLEGEYEGTVINRDYVKINEYLVKAKIANEKNSKITLTNHGVDDIIIKTGAAKPVTYKFMDGYELTAPLETLINLQLIYGINYKAIKIADAFPAEYKNKIKSFEQLMERIHLLYSEYIAKMLQWSLKVLMWYGIDTYDANAILDECVDLALLPRVPQFEQELDIIEDRATQLNIKLAYTQATRGRWVGGGYGTTISDTIATSIKSSVVSGVMNVGSGILHGIGDSIAESINNSEINKMQKKLFEDPNTQIEFKNAVWSACSDIGNTLSQLIEQHTKIKFVGVKGTVEYHGENLSSIDDRTLISKINNNLSIGNLEYVYALLIENLRRTPMNRDTYTQLSEITIKRIMGGIADDTNNGVRSLSQYKGDFGL